MCCHSGTQRHHFLLDRGVQEGTLIHDLQNHDEITFQLFEVGSMTTSYTRAKLNGKQLKDQILNQMRSSVAGNAGALQQTLPRSAGWTRHHIYGFHCSGTWRQ